MKTKIFKYRDASKEQPENSKPVFALVKTLAGNLIADTVSYSRGNDIEVDDENSEDGHPKYLPVGWYSNQEQRAGIYDEIWIDRVVIYWAYVPTVSIG